ncbi:ribonuclease P protein component [Candidatus Uhrbacteria bacterium]|nr:ribonuclease P protein component [Candidatus Uhrbacteria bacterium]
MLPAPYRLRKTKDIEQVFSGGKSVFDAVCGLRCRPNGQPVSRFAVVVGTKVSKSAVVRNRLRRRVRAILQKCRTDIAAGFDVVCLVRPDAKKATFRQLEDRLQASLRKARLLV